MTADRYFRGAEFPDFLPFSATDPIGRNWTDLVNNPEGIQACGYVLAPATPEYNEYTQELTWDTSTRQWGLVDRPPLPPGPLPQYAPLTLLAFVRLVQGVGGMTPELYMAARKNEAFGYMWDMLNFAKEVVRDDPLTAQALGALHAADYMPKSAEDVLAAWPTT